MKRWTGCAALLINFVFALTATDAGASPLPEPSPPAGLTIVREVQAGGVQVYTCRMTANAYGWTLSGPKALLVNDDGSDFGTHSAGPTWTALDGSSILGDGAHPLVKIERTDSVPALLLSVKASHGTGLLTNVRFVRRSQTVGGLPPETGCDTAHVGDSIASRYSAVYTFYR